MAQDLTITMDQQDLRRINERLNQLGSIVKDGIVQRGLREGANVIAKQVKSNINTRGHVRTGKLLASVSIMTRKKNGKVYIGFKRGDGYGGNIAHIVDKGTNVRATKFGANRGRVIASHFHTDAVQAKKNEAMHVLYQSIQESLNRIWNR